MRDVMTYKGFVGSEHYANEDRIFYGKVEGVNDLITFEGSTVDELDEGFRYMVDEHIKDCKKTTSHLRNPIKGISISAYLPKYTRKLLIMLL